jgi:AhpD family alkylhydroperoxidase
MKYKELIAVADALTTQCPYCIDIPSGNGRKAGATDVEKVGRVRSVAGALRSGSRRLALGIALNQSGKI